MEIIRGGLRRFFDYLEAGLGWVFPSQWNPLFNLGALGFFFYWIVTATGIYVFVLFDTSVLGAYPSVEHMTHDQWYVSGVMRSLHRYASDGLVLVMLIHLLREFSRDRYRGVRWFSWVTGVPVLVMIYVSGISGYWLVWDKLAQYVAVVSTEWLDKPGVFGEPIARNFLHTGMLDNRFFTLMIFLHIAAPLIALVIMWIHLQRVTKPRINPPRGLALGTFGSMLALSLIYPALSQGPASLSEVPGSVGLDWFYLGLYPLLDTWPGTVTWSATGTLLFILCAMPWLPPLRRTPPAAVDLENCNGCSRCFNDCPYNAIMMAPRTDALPFESQPVVSASLCTSCGICAGSCPTAMPFRRHSALRAGIDLPDHSIPGLRSTVHEASERLEGEARILVFGCEHGPPLEDIAGPSTGIVSVRCLGQLPPSFIDYVLSKNLADGVLLAACTDNNCYFRFGERWTSQRIARQRDPHLRARVPAERLATCQTGPLGRRKLESAIKDLTASVARSKGDGQAAVSGGHTRRRSQSHD